MDIIEKIKYHFNESAQLKISAAEILPTAIASASELITQCFLGGYKILSCGDSSSACDAQYFASKMLNRFERERPSLPAIALSADIATVTSIANDYSFNEIFSKQIRALGQGGDILLIISIRGNSPNVLYAIEAAHDRGMNIIALTGHEAGELVSLLEPQDIEISVPSNTNARIQETHLLILNCLCDLIDHNLFGQETT